MAPGWRCAPQWPICNANVLGADSTFWRARGVDLIMGGLSPIHWIIIAVAAILLFGGRGKISSVMGDAAKGVKAFRDGLKDDHEAAAPPAPAATPSPPPVQADKDPIVR